MYFSQRKEEKAPRRDDWSLEKPKSNKIDSLTSLTGRFYISKSPPLKKPPTSHTNLETGGCLLPPKATHLQRILTLALQHLVKRDTCHTLRLPPMQVATFLVNLTLLRHTTQAKDSKRRTCRCALVFHGAAADRISPRNTCAYFSDSACGIFR